MIRYKTKIHYKNSLTLLSIIRKEFSQTNFLNSSVTDEDEQSSLIL